MNRIEELEKQIEEKKKINVIQCSWCGLSEQTKDVELLVVEREVLKQVMEVINNFNFGKHLEDANIDGEEVYYGFNTTSLLEELEDVISGGSE